MKSRAFRFELQHTDAGGRARSATLHTPHGPVQLPAFMPVGTRGTVKGLEAGQLRATGTRMVLANTYHLAVQPGETVVQQLGGLHRFMGWDGPILTDSGGFQLFSLARLNRVTDASATFRAHTDGRLMELSPRRAVQIQETLGSDIAMVLDHVVSLPNQAEVIRDACRRTVLWAQQSLAAHGRSEQALFAIVQGGLNDELRAQCARQLVQLDFDGFAVGGLSVGETATEMYRTLDVTCPLLPVDRPRYLMGVGRPRDLLEAIGRGIDMFDCVMPTRNGRNALAFTDEGTLRLRNLCHKTDQRPIDPACVCLACRHSRGYIRHLFMAREMLGPVLLSLHNVTYYQQLMTQAREAIGNDQFEHFYQAKIQGWGEMEGPQ